MIGDTQWAQVATQEIIIKCKGETKNHSKGGQISQIVVVDSPIRDQVLEFSCMKP